MIVPIGKARIRHAESAQVYEISLDEISFEPVSGEERGMGQESAYSAEVDHPELGLICWNVWEYPVGTLNYHDPDLGPHRLLENFDFELQDRLPADDDFED